MGNLSVHHVGKPAKDKIKKYLPEGFKGQYQDIQGIFECTEIKCDMPKDYQTQSEFCQTLML